MIFKKIDFLEPNFLHKLQIDHERILPLYESDSAEEFDFLKEKFVKRKNLVFEVGIYG